jgi:hypothetical protein
LKKLSYTPPNFTEEEVTDFKFTTGKKRALREEGVDAAAVGGVHRGD